MGCTRKALSHIEKIETEGLNTENIKEKETKYRQNIEIYNIQSNGEIHRHLVTKILPGYLLLLFISLIYGIITGNSEYFNGILNFVTPLLVTVYGFFFWKDTKAK